MEIVWNCVTESDWQAVLPDHAGALQQSWHFGAAVAALGRQVQRAEFVVGGQTVALAQVVSRGAGPLRLAYLPRGPIWLDAPSIDLQRRALRLIRKTFPLLICVPEQDTPDVLPLVTRGHMAELQLIPDKSAMRGTMRGKWRNRLVRAEAAGLSIAHKTPDASELGWMSAQDAMQQRARGYRALPPAFLRVWAGCGGMQLYTARYEGQIVAAMLFLTHAPGATYQIGWSGALGRQTSAHHLLLWQAMQDLAASGLRRLDLGTLDTVTAPGLARFKLGAGAQPRALGASGLCMPLGDFHSHFRRARGLLRSNQAPEMENRPCPPPKT